MSLYSEYIKEREGIETVESDRGFATFLFQDKECYIKDIYVRPEYRKTDEASTMANIIAEVAKRQGCKYLTGSVAPNTKGATESMKVLLAYGFKLAKSTPELIWFFKEL